MEEELRINSRHLEKSNSAKQKLERDLDEVSVTLHIIIMPSYYLYYVKVFDSYYLHCKTDEVAVFVPCYSNRLSSRVDVGVLDVSSISV